MKQGLWAFLGALAGSFLILVRRVFWEIFLPDKSVSVPKRFFSIYREHQSILGFRLDSSFEISKPEMSLQMTVIGLVLPNQRVVHYDKRLRDCVWRGRAATL